MILQRNTEILVFFIKNPISSVLWSLKKGKESELLYFKTDG